MTKPKAAGYVITHGDLIFGCGFTADEAWDDALTTLADARIDVVSDGADYPDEDFAQFVRERDLKTYAASAALLTGVAERGGNIAWRAVGVVACTYDEADQCWANRNNQSDEAIG